MQLSKRGEYGLRAMIQLAHPCPDGSVRVMQINEIASLENMPVKFLEQILLTLKNSGYLHSKRGSAGGYYLAKPASEIMLGQIIRLLDGPIAPIRCVSRMAYEPCGCPDANSCGLRMTMEDVREAMTAILDYTSLAEVSRRSLAVRQPG
jgi:Rrf2 family protein